MLLHDLNITELCKKMTSLAIYLSKILAFSYIFITGAMTWTETMADNKNEKACSPVLFHEKQAFIYTI